MSDKVTVDIEGKLATIRLDDGKANAFDHDMFDAVNAALDEADAAKAVAVIRGNAKMFSGGYDLKTMMRGPDAARDLVKRGSELAVRFMERPHPVIVASDGHMLALSGFLFMAADWRIGKRPAPDGKPFKIGLPETPNSLPMHNFGREMSAYRLSKPHFVRAFLHGEMFDADSAVTVGFYDVATDDVDASIAEAVEALSKINTPVYANNKAMGFKTILPVLKQAIEDDLGLGISV